MLIKKAPTFRRPRSPTSASYLRRREFIQLGAGLIGAAAGGVVAAVRQRRARRRVRGAPANALPQTPIANVTKKMVTTTEPLNKFEEITGYNNYYEFGTGKSDPAKYAGQLKTARGRSRSTASATSPATITSTI